MFPERLEQELQPECGDGETQLCRHQLLTVLAVSGLGSLRAFVIIVIYEIEDTWRSRSYILQRRLLK